MIIPPRVNIPKGVSVNVSDFAGPTLNAGTLKPEPQRQRRNAENAKAKPQREEERTSKVFSYFTAFLSTFPC